MNKTVIYRMKNINNFKIRNIRNSGIKQFKIIRFADDIIIIEQFIYINNDVYVL